MCNKCEDAGKRGGRHSALIPFGWSSFPRLRPGGGYHCRLRFSPPPPPLSPCPLSFRVHLVSIVIFMRSPHTLATVQISFPCFSLFSFRVVFCLLVYISFNLSFPCVRRTPLLRYKFRFRVSLYFPFGWSSRPMGDPAEGSAIIYDCFFESVSACRLCKRQRGPSLA